jgi:hypothetical protein
MGIVSPKTRENHEFRRVPLRQGLVERHRLFGFQGNVVRREGSPRDDNCQLAEKRG